MIDNSESWLKMKNMNFIDIVNNSNIQFDSWKNFQYVLKEEYSDKVIKPVNNYVKHFGLKPILKKQNNKYILKYMTSAEIFLMIQEDNSFYAVEKSWLRQFYLSNNIYKLEDPDAISKDIYRFYIPWFVDYDVAYNIMQPEDSNSIKIFNTSGAFQKADKECIIKDTGFVDFYFTKSDSHMINDNVGLIKRGTPVYEIHIEADKDLSILLEREYE